MPAFDPVRDAVLNSPTATSVPQPFPSPSLGRRATDLSVLLNEDADQRAPSRPPPVRSASSLSHLLHNEETDTLSSFEPIRRAPSPRTRHFHAISPPQDDTFHRPTSSSSRTSDIRPDVYPSPVVTEALPPPSPATISRPSSAASSAHLPPRSTASPAMQPPRPAPAPYSPKNRRTPATSVLVPMTDAEMKMYKTYIGKGTARLAKRKRGASSEADPYDQPPLKRSTNDEGIVAQHYNSRPEVGIAQRQDSPIIGLKNFNNWVKSVLITSFAHPVLAQSTIGQGRSRGRVLDMGCGKGGDIIKWSKAKIYEYVGADIASVSVEQARSRWQTMRNRSFNATFAAVDCYTQSISTALPPEVFARPFDVVSMQFCMHYAFESEDKARCMLDNVSRWLRPGGVFIGTIPNDDLLMDQLDSLAPTAEELAFGNAVYQIRFQSRDPRPTYGHKYHFYLQDAVDDVPEYVVRWDNFVVLCREYGLVPKYKAGFHAIYSQYSEHPELGSLLMKRMKVLDEHGETSLDEDQWEAANVYIAFVFEKRPRGSR